MSEEGKAKLTTGLLNMKFMKKSKEKSEIEAEEEKRKMLYESEIPEVVVKGEDLFILEPSFVPCLKLLNGRFSFKGMNPEIEKLMEDSEINDPDKLKQMDGVSNKEMAKRYSTLMNTMKKKFTSKRKWTNSNDSDNDEAVCPQPPNRHSKSGKSLKFRKPPDN